LDRQLLIEDPPVHSHHTQLGVLQNDVAYITKPPDLQYRISDIPCIKWVLFAAMNPTFPTELNGIVVAAFLVKRGREENEKNI
jgi:hypothetical protein